MNGKSIVIFTNFWDADTVINYRFLLFHDLKNQKFYKINLLGDKKGKDINYSAHSIALSHPDFKNKSNLKNINRIDCFCPTYDMLKRYKENHDWDSYRKDFIGLIKKRKEAMKEWAASLIPNRIYFLCCWENTSSGAHCHREILYKAFLDSKVMSKNILPVYRHGNEAKEDNRRLDGLPVEITAQAVSFGPANPIITYSNPNGNGGAFMQYHGQLIDIHGDDSDDTDEPDDGF